MFRGGGCLGKSEKIIGKETFRVNPELRGGSCPLTEVSPGSRNCMSKGLELSCFGISYGAVWGMKPERRLKKETRLQQTVGCTRVLCKGCNKGCSMADPHFSTAFPAGCKGGSKEARAGRLRSESQLLWRLAVTQTSTLHSPHETPGWEHIRKPVRPLRTVDFPR